MFDRLIRIVTMFYDFSLTLPLFLTDWFGLFNDVWFDFTLMFDRLILIVTTSVRRRACELKMTTREGSSGWSIDKIVFFGRELWWSRKSSYKKIQNLILKLTCLIIFYFFYFLFTFRTILFRNCVNLGSVLKKFNHLSLKLVSLSCLCIKILKNGKKIWQVSFKKLLVLQNQMLKSYWN